MSHQIDPLFLGLGDGVLHGLLVQQAVLHQSLREATQCYATGVLTDAIAFSFMDLR